MKIADVKKMDAKEREKKLKELEMELIKSNVSSAKGSGSGKTKEIKKTIAKILTFNK